jgi:ketosteroid isomerase-like protein
LVVSRTPLDFAARVGADCVWIVAGTSAIAGEYRGRDAVLSLFRRLHELTDGTYSVDFEWELDDGERGVASYRARGSRPDGRRIDLQQAIVYRLEDGRWAEVRALPFDQRLFDAFWA